MKNEHNTNEYKDSLSDKILSQISQERITPTPRWHFVLKEDTLWTVWFISVLVGAMGVTGSLYTFKNAGWEFYSITHTNALSFVIDSMPYFWILSLAVFMVIGYFNIRYTKKGYKYSLVAVLGASVLASVAIGSLLYVAGAGDLIDRKIAGKVPFHRPVSEFVKKAWQDSERGLVSGSVLSFSTSTEELYLRGFDGQVWLVSTEGLPQKDLFVARTVSEVRVAGVEALAINSTTTKSIIGCFIFPLRALGAAEESEIISIEDERKLGQERNSKCRGVRPYDSLQKIRNNIYTKPNNENITR